MSGWELLWVLVAVDDFEALRQIGVPLEVSGDVIAAYIGGAEGADLVASIEEKNEFHTIRFLQFDGNEWKPLLILCFDMGNFSCESLGSFGTQC